MFHKYIWSSSSRTLAWAAALGVAMLAAGVVAVRAGWREAALRGAAGSGDLREARLLLLLGADPNARDAGGGASLFFAAGHAHPSMVQLLLSRGANAALVDAQGQTALDASLGSGSPQSPGADELLIAGGGLPATRCPFASIQWSTTSSAHIGILLKHGVDPNAAALDGSTPLMWFAGRGDVSAMRALVDGGARVQHAAADGRTALSEAVSQGWPEAVQYLVDCGADPAGAVNGKTLLQIARAGLAANRTAAPMVQRRQRVVSFLQGLSHPTTNASQTRH